MRRRYGLFLAAACLALSMIRDGVGADRTKAPPAASKGYKPKLTAWGEPDLRGTWPIDYLNGLVLERDPNMAIAPILNDTEYAEAMKRQDALRARYENDDKDGKIGRGHWDEAGEATRQTSLIVEPANGRLPRHDRGGQAPLGADAPSWRRNQSYDTPSDFDSWDRCITRGLPASMLPMHYNNGIRVWQSPGLVAIELEMIHETRLIPTDGKARVPRAITNWMGESRGRWENGNTLVVETTTSGPGRRPPTR